MSDEPTIYYWSDTSNWFLNYAFFIYTPKQVEEFSKKNPMVKFKRIGYATELDDISYAMLKACEYDIINDDEYILNNDFKYMSHFRTAF